MTSMTFQVRELSVALGERQVLRSLTLDFPAGRVVGLIGQNGSGKSTLLRSLARHVAPQSGDILLDGVALARWNARAFARSVAFMPQFTPATDGMNVRELVSLGRYPWHGAFGRFTPQDVAQVDEALARTDLAAMADRSVDTLSGGERQRVWLATMLAQNARFLLLDEPTSALDLAQETAMLRLLRDVCRERRVGVVIVLHDVNLAARFCDDLVALRDGRLVAQGAVDEMMEGRRLTEIFGVPMGVLAHPARRDAIGYVL